MINLNIPKAIECKWFGKKWNVFRSWQLLYMVIQKGDPDIKLFSTLSKITRLVTTVTGKLVYRFPTSNRFLECHTITTPVQLLIRSQNS